MDTELEDYTRELLKGYCDKIPTQKIKFNSKINLVKKYSTNVLEDHSPESIKQCKIRETDPQVNITDPIEKTQESLEEILGNIIKAECEVTDQLNPGVSSLTPVLGALIKYCNRRILEFSKNRIDSVENCNFNVKALGQNKKIDFTLSTLYSLDLLLFEIFKNTIPFRICQNIDEIKQLRDKVILFHSERDPSHIESKLNEYMFQTYEDNKICLSNSKVKIDDYSQFIQGLYSTFCNNSDLSLYIPELQKSIENILQTNMYTNIKPLPESNFYYLSNPGDGDCLFIATAKYLCMLSNSQRNYPTNTIIKEIAEDLRYQTCKYMYNNRYKVINNNGTIELNTESFMWMLDAENIQDFRKLMKALKIKSNKSIFRNPTSFTIKEIIDMHSSGDETLDNFTKYCILMAQHTNESKTFSTGKGKDLSLSKYAGICELACLSLYLNKMIVCVSISDTNKSGEKYYITGARYSFFNIPDYYSTNNFPIIVYLRGHRTTTSGSSSDHFELIWSKHHTKPNGITSPPKIVKPNKALFKNHAIVPEKLLPVNEDTLELGVELDSFDLDNYLQTTYPMTYIEEPIDIIVEHWSDMQMADRSPDALEFDHFSDPEKEIYIESNTIRLGKFNYTLRYLFRYTGLLEKGFVTKVEINKELINIKQTEDLELDKPIKVEYDDDAESSQVYTNFKANETDKLTLKTYRGSEDIMLYSETKVKSKEDQVTSIVIDSEEFILLGSHYYNKKYLAMPLITYQREFSKITKKLIVKTLKRQGLHLYTKPIRIIENWGGHGDQEFLYSLFDLEDVDHKEELDGLIEIGAIKILDPTNPLQPTKYTDETPQENPEEKTPDKPQRKVFLLQNVGLDTLKNACKSKTQKQDGLNRKLFKEALIKYVELIYPDDPKRIKSEKRKLRKMTKRRELEEYCVSVDLK